MQAVLLYYMRRLLFIGLLIALMGGAQAEELINYSEEIGPYVVSFSLPELQSGPVEFEKNISQTETLSGIIDDMYELTMRSGGHPAGFLIINRFGEDVEYDLALHLEHQVEYFEGAGFVVVPAERKIDGVAGTILRVDDVPNDAELFDLFYQKDRRTTVQGGIMLAWDQTVPLLRTLNITSSSVP
ncbi:MAG: hypothetical protein WC261_10265 [Synergistaceae bacterium]|jgi:hypothetical protein